MSIKGIAVRHVISLVIILLSLLAFSGCATSRGIPVGGGWRMHVGIETNTVVVSNFSTFNGDLSMNGNRPIQLEIGDTVRIELGAVVRRNVFVFRAFSQNAEGQLVLRGRSTNSFQGGSGQTYQWDIGSVQPIQ